MEEFKGIVFRQPTGLDPFSGGVEYIGIDESEKRFVDAEYWNYIFGLRETPLSPECIESFRNWCMTCLGMNNLQADVHLIAFKLGVAMCRDQFILTGHSYPEHYILDDEGRGRSFFATEFEEYRSRMEFEMHERNLEAMVMMNEEAKERSMLFETG